MQKIRYINFPVLVPTIVIMLILNCGNLLSVGYEKIYLLQTPLNTNVSEVISTYVYKVGLVNAQYSFSTAVGLFNSVVNLILLLLVNTIARKISDTSLW
ncbi:MAG: sugar ABC transporter permease, partial [Acutalibacteraceae bacterium]|jgi:putative aldouronate transport system permease protein